MSQNVINIISWFEEPNQSGGQCSFDKHVAFSQFSLGGASRITSGFNDSTHETCIFSSTLRGVGSSNASRPSKARQPVLNLGTISYHFGLFSMPLASSRGTSASPPATRQNSPAIWTRGCHPTHTHTRTHPLSPSLLETSTPTPPTSSRSTPPVECAQQQQHTDG